MANRAGLLSGKRLTRCLFPKKARRRTQGSIGQSSSIQFLKIVEHIVLKSISKLVKDKKVIRNSQHRFIKGNFCLTSPVVCCRKIIGNVDEGESRDFSEH